LTRSYSLYDLGDDLAERVAPDWDAQRRWALSLLQREEELLATVQLLGTDSLADAERLILRTGRMIREDFLQQSSFDAIDAFCSLDKQYWMLWTIRQIHEHRSERLDQDEDRDHEHRADVAAAQAKTWPVDRAEANARALVAEHRGADS